MARVALLLDDLSDEEWRASLPPALDCWAPPEDEPWRLHAVPDPEPVRAAEAIRWNVPGLWEDPPVPPPAPPVGPQVQAVADAVDALEQVTVTAVPELVALAELDHLLHVEQRLRRVKLQRLADARTRRLETGLREGSLSRWMRQQHPGSDRTDLTLADQLRDFPVLEQAVVSDALPVAAGRRVLRALRKLKPLLDRPDGLLDGQPAGPVVDAVVDNTVDLIGQARMGLADDDPLLLSLLDQTARIKKTDGTDADKVETALLLLAQHVTEPLLPGCLTQQVDALLPSELEQRAQQAHERRELRLNPGDDGRPGTIEIRPDAELWELLHTCLASEARRDPQNPADTSAWAAARQGQQTAPDSLAQSLFGQEELDWAVTGGVARPRHRGQRLHDALKQLLQRYLDADLGGTHDKAPVTMHVTVSEARVDGRPGALPALGASGQRLPVGLLRRWWCDASVTPWLVRRGWIPLGHQHRQRTLTAVERQALRLRDRGCAGRGCCRSDDPLLQLEPHHVRGYAEHGTTSLGETIWACPTLHHDLHHGRTVQLRNDRWLDEHGWTDAPQQRFFSYP